MPTIPTYESKVLPTKDVVGAQGSALRAAGTAAAHADAALEQAGETLFHIGQKWQDKIEKAKQADQLSWGLAEQSKRQHDLYLQTIDSPEWRINPEAGKV